MFSYIPGMRMNYLVSVISLGGRIVVSGKLSEQFSGSLKAVVRRCLSSAVTFLGHVALR